MLEHWSVAPLFRAAHWPQGNAIVERHHRSVKKMRKMTGLTLQECVFWHNAMPTGPEWRLPHKWRFAADVLTPFVVAAKSKWVGSNLKNQTSFDPTLRVGDVVYVRPPGARYDPPWKVGWISARNSAFNVSVVGFLLMQIIHVPLIIACLLGPPEYKLLAELKWGSKPLNSVLSFDLDSAAPGKSRQLSRSRQCSIPNPAFKSMLYT